MPIVYGLRGWSNYFPRLYVELDDNDGHRSMAEASSLSAFLKAITVDSIPIAFIQTAFPHQTWLRSYSDSWN